MVLFIVVLFFFFFRWLLHLWYSKMSLGAFAFYFGVVLQGADAACKGSRCQGGRLLRLVTAEQLRLLRSRRLSWTQGQICFQDWFEGHQSTQEKQHSLEQMQMDLLNIYKCFALPLSPLDDKGHVSYVYTCPYGFLGLQAQCTCISDKFCPVLAGLKLSWCQCPISP